MSIEHAKVFIERMKTDEVFADEVVNCDDCASRVELIQSAGLDFSLEEVKCAVSDLTGESQIDRLAWCMNLPRFFR